MFSFSRNSEKCFDKKNWLLLNTCKPAGHLCSQAFQIVDKLLKKCKLVSCTDNVKMFFFPGCPIYKA